MLKKYISIVLMVITVLGINYQAAFAKSQNDWSKVTSLTNNEIAVKTSDGKTVFGKLTSANDKEITIQTADKKAFTGQSITFQKSEVKKIWSANLRFGKNPAFATGIGAAVGGGIGLGLGFGLLAATGGSDSTNEILGEFTVIGASAGAGLGYLLGRQSHQKKDLIYEI